MLNRPTVSPCDSFTPGFAEASDELGRAVLSSLPAQIAVLDRGGRIIAVNQAWSEFAAANGGGERCGVGSNYVDVCRAAAGVSEAEQAMNGLQEVLTGTRALFTMEYPCHSSDERRWFLLTAAPLKRAGGGAVVSHLNITDRKRAQRVLRRRARQLARMTRQLKRSNEELDQFAYITSHDLRAPLRGIANLSQWIEEDLGPAMTSDARQQMDLLRGRVHRMEALISGLLEYSRIGRVRGATQQVDVGPLLVETIDLLAPSDGARVEVVGPMPTVPAHRLRLQQVFMNLIGNALKHGRASGVVPHVRVSARDLGRFIAFAIADNGPGIAPEYHERIFVIFQTLAARDKVEGTGVGLALVKKIVEANGGQVRVESAEGAGATFTFTWPKEVKEG